MSLMPTKQQTWESMRQRAESAESREQALAARIRELEAENARLRENEKAQQSGAFVAESIAGLMEADPHKFDIRPCSTCATISKLIERNFGCVAREAQALAELQESNDSAR